MRFSLKTTLALLMIFLLMLSVYVFYKTWPTKDAVHHQVLEDFLELGNNQMELKQIILKVRLNQNSNFDRLSFLQNRQENLVSSLKKNVSISLKNESNIVLSKLNKYFEHQQNISILIGDFIRSSAILKNSISYFIYLGQDFSSYLDDRANFHKHSLDVKKIIADTLILDISLQEELNISNDTNALILSEILREAKVPRESNFTFLPKHLDKITEHKQLMEKGMQAILIADVEKMVEATLLSYLEQVDTLEKKKRIYLDLTFFLIVFLIVFIAYYIFSLKKIRGDLLGEVNMLYTVMQQSHEAIMVTDTEGNIEHINAKFSKITGYNEVEILGENSRVVQPKWVSDKNQAEFMAVLNNGKAWRSEVQYRNKEGKMYWAFESISSIKNEQGKITNYLSTHRDITQEHKLNEQLSFHASHDELTGLFNRREFEQRAEILLSSSSNNEECHALCFMDLDQFKVVNDTCGHAAGDELLRQLGAALKSKMRKSDTLARLGGDEFGVLMGFCSLEKAYQVASALKKVIQDYQFSWQDRNFKVGVSMGLVEITKETSDLSELMKNADASCYMAKEKGRNRIHVYSTKDTDIAKRQGQMQWVERINQALEEDRFCLYAQAIVPLDGSADVHYELLIRMLDDQGKIIPPGAFLAAAERYDLIGGIERWVVKNAFELLLEHPRFLKQINFVSINLSGPSLASPEFLDFVYKALKETSLPSEKICFEITETAAISNLNRATLFISAMKKLGCRFALDDFGSGLSSFGYLKNLPVDFLKIDGMFVKNIVADKIDRAMVKSINEIGHVMEMKTIAEFVENDEIKNVLTDMGVNYAQGYGVGKPQLFNDLLSLEQKG